MPSDLGRFVSEESRLKARMSNSRTEISVTDILTGKETIYPSINAVTGALGINSGVIIMCFKRKNRGKPYINLFIFKKLESTPILKNSEPDTEK